jgi:hypothetical protein
MTAIAGVDVGNATTEVVVLADGVILGAGRVPTRGRKGSPDSLRAAAALVRRVARQAGTVVGEARIAPLRPVDTSVRVIPDVAPPTGRLRVLAAGVATPGGAGVGVGAPLLLGNPPGTSRPAGPVIVVVPPRTRYDRAAAAIRELLAAGTAVGAVLVAGDEAVLVANRLPPALRGVPLIDQVDADAAAACTLLAVEVRPPGHPLTALADPVALGAAFGLGEREAADAAAISRSLLDFSNAVVGLTSHATPAPALPSPDWSLPGDADLDDVFTVDLAAAAEAATARRGSLGRAFLVAALHRPPAEAGAAAAELAGRLGVPVTSPLTEPAAARLGAATTPGLRPGALVADIGSGTIDAIAADGREAVVAGAGELLTVAVAEALGVPRAAADWIKRGPCVRLDGGQRYEAEDGSRGFLDGPAPAAAAGMLAVPGPGGLVPFAGRSGRPHTPSEWRAIRLRLKQAVLAASLRRALTALGEPGTRSPAGSPAQLLLVGGPAADHELVGVLTRSLPDTITVGRGNLGATRDGEPLGHRYAVALGLALALSAGRPGGDDVLGDVRPASPPIERKLTRAVLKAVERERKLRGSATPSREECQCRLALTPAATLARLPSAPSCSSDRSLAGRDRPGRRGRHSAPALASPRRARLSPASRSPTRRASSAARPTPRRSARSPTPAASCPGSGPASPATGPPTGWRCRPSGTGPW